jgi:peroxiredoxin Q/BCP
MNLERKKAPDFDLEGSDGRRHRLKDYSGKTVILYFYPKDDTPGCTKEACGFRDLQQNLKKTGAVVLGISKDTSASHEKFAQKYALPFTLLSDLDTKVMKAYGAWGEKQMYGKTVEGTNPIHGCDRSRRQSSQALDERKKRRRASGKGF